MNRNRGTFVLLKVGAALLSVAILVLVGSSVVWAQYQAAIIESTELQSQEHRPIAIAENDCVGTRFLARCPFSEISICCPSYSDDTGDLRASLYRWNRSFVQTIQSKPLTQKIFVDFSDNALLMLRTDSAWPAGEYLLTLDQGRKQVGVWVIPNQIPNSQSYFNGKEIPGTMQMSWRLIKSSPFPFSGAREAYERACQPSSCPAEKPAVPTDPIGANDVQPDTFAAIDDLGRVLPGFEQTGAVRLEKQVGIFYWTWHDTEQIKRPKIYNNTQILRENPGIETEPDDPVWGPWYSTHHWDEPLLGYYATTDEWVLRRHAQWLASAQIDVAIFDCTNGTLTWMDSTWALLKTWSQARRDGVKTPKIAFMLPFWNKEYTATDLLQLYRDIYRDGKYQELWYYWQGRPLIYALPDAADEMIARTTGAQKAEWETIRRFFAFRPGQPDYRSGSNRPDDWSWLEIYPQNGYGKRLDGTFDMISVGIAQNFSMNKRNGSQGLAAMNDENVFGRAWVVDQNPDLRPDAYKYGGNFAQQWSRAYEIDPQFVFVTGWNEWIAGRFKDWMGTYSAYPDEYDERFSRDAEPCAGSLRDSYYNQLVAQIRRFKGTRPAPQFGPNVSIPMTSGACSASSGAAPDPWLSVSPTFRDYRHDTADRNGIGYAQIQYTNQSGRNDIVLSKVARDDEYLYFMAETEEKLSPLSDPNWMQLYLRTSDDSAVPNWYGFHYLVNRTNPKTDGKKAGELSLNGKATLERSTGGWNWERVADVTIRIADRRLEIQIPRSALQYSGVSLQKLQFKWVDNGFRPSDGSENGSENNGSEPDILDFYQYGDAAPDGRFLYQIQ